MKAQFNINNSSTSNNNNNDTNYNDENGGVCSQRPKLLKHPIENIGRKIVLAYSLAIVFKLLALLTGPPIVLIANCLHACARWAFQALLAAFSCVKSRRWFASRALRCCCRCFNNKTRATTSTQTTTTVGNKHVDDNSSNNNNDFNIDNENENENNNSNNDNDNDNWLFKPLTFTELYWFKPNLINVCVLKVESPQLSAGSCTQACVAHHLRRLVRDRILRSAKYRKFCCRVCRVGPKLIAALCWQYLELCAEDSDSLTSTASTQVQQQQQQREHRQATTTPTSATTTDNNKSDNKQQQQLSSINLNCNVSANNNQQFANDDNNNYNDVDDDANVVELSKHIFVDDSIGEPCSLSGVQDYARALLANCQPLSDARPLWEMRIIRAANSNTAAAAAKAKAQQQHQRCDNTSHAKPKQRLDRCMESYYIVFRCHQCLADGASLVGLLSSKLAVEQVATAATRDSNLQAAGLEAPQVFSRPSVRASFVVRDIAGAVRTAVLVGPLTVLLWLVWTYTRRKAACLQVHKPLTFSTNKTLGLDNNNYNSNNNKNKTYSKLKQLCFAHYDLTKLFQIKQLTQSTCTDLLTFAMSGALRNYLRLANKIANPPNLNISLAVDLSEYNATIGKRCKVPKQASKKLQYVSGTQQHLDCNNNNNNNFVSEQATGNESLVNLALVSLPLPVNTEGAIPRLWKVRHLMQDLRNSADPFIVRYFQRFVCAFVPATVYQTIVNFITQRNASVFISNIVGPNLMIESWCVDLLRTTILNDLNSNQQQQQQQQQVQAINIENQNQNLNSNNNNNELINDSSSDCKEIKEVQDEDLRKKRNAELKKYEFKLDANLGNVKQIYYCYQPPTNDTAISLNCISFKNKLFVTCYSKSILIDDASLLVKLMFAQLNQLANTIAKRRVVHKRTNIVSVMQSQVQINCIPPSPFLLVSNPTIFSTPSVASNDDEFDLKTNEEEINNQAVSQNNITSGSQFNKVTADDNDDTLMLNAENNCCQSNSTQKNKLIMQFEQQTAIKQRQQVLQLQQLKSSNKNNSRDDNSVKSTRIDSIVNDESKELSTRRSKSLIEFRRLSSLIKFNQQQQANIITQQVDSQQSQFDTTSNQTQLSTETTSSKEQQFYNYNNNNNNNNKSAIGSLQFCPISPTTAASNNNNYDKNDCLQPSPKVSKSDSCLNETHEHRFDNSSKIVAESLNDIASGNNRLKIDNKRGNKTSSFAQLTPLKSNSQIETLTRHLNRLVTASLSVWSSRRRQSVATSVNVGVVATQIQDSQQGLQFNLDLEGQCNSKSDYICYRGMEYDGPLRNIRARRFSTIAIGSNNLVPFGLMQSSSLPKFRNDDKETNL